MPVEIADVAINALASETAKRLYGIVGEAITSKRKSKNSLIEESLCKHLRFASSWSRQYSFLGLTNPRESKLSTIPLRLSDTPRRYRSKSSVSSSEISEDQLLSIGNSIVLLGDPGAGKTTTLKRMCLSLLSEDKKDSQIDYQVPIVVVLREHHDNGSIIPFLAETLCVQIEKSEEENVANRWKTTSGGSAIAHISNILNEIGGLLIIDGLDEVFAASRPSIEREIEYISQHTPNSNLIVSCRSGDYNRHLENFSVLEILPLSYTEIESISTMWLGNSDGFLKSLDDRPYKDIVDRPLLLAFLIFLFQMEGSLPQKPVQIYRKVVYRLLREWDEERGIERGSSYSSFDVDTKIDFLSEFSYLLTYQLKERGFSEEDALQIIGEVSGTYGLPGSDFLKILREIETHTGIVTAAGFSRFEFAHLSIQEFLCANYICRSPAPQLLRNYLVEYPAPVAVACALSSQPEVFLNEMLKRHVLEKYKNPEDFFHSIQSESQLLLDLFGQDTGDTLASFLDRLGLEQPSFRSGVEFGEAIVLLYSFYYRRYNKKIDDLIDKLSGSDNGRLSLEIYFSQIKISGYEISRNTAAFEFSPIFHDLHFRMTGLDGRINQKWDILPLAMIPAKILKQSGVELIESGNIEYRERMVKKNLSGTQLCNIEFGRHQRRTQSSSCERCGNLPSDLAKSRKNPRRGRY